VQRAPAFWFFLASLALSLAVVWDLIVPLSVGATLAFVSERPIAWGARRIRREGRAARAALTLGFMVLVLAVVAAPLGIALYIAARDLVALVVSRDAEAWAELLARAAEVVASRVAALGIDIAPHGLAMRVRALAVANAGQAASWTGAALSTTPGALFDGAVILLAWGTLALEGKAARDRVLARLLPWPHEREILRSVTAEVIQSTLVANLAVSAIQAVAMSIALVVVGVPRALVWGVLTFFFSFVPVVGTAPITLGAAAYLFSNGRPGAAVGALVFGVLAAGVDNVLRPLFLRGSSVELGFLWVLVALIGGLALFGLPGVILGPLAFSLLAASLRALEALEAPASPASPAPTEPRAG
jgi:predicted PurR-regulated permease PerM